jgi:hypothetical protein
MADDESDQRRDELLLKLLKSPPLSRAELKAELGPAREAEKARKAAIGPSRRVARSDAGPRPRAT